MVLTESTNLALGSPASHFALPDTRSGYTISPSDFSGQAIVIAFICNHCPYVIHLLDAFTQFANTKSKEGVTTIAISANDAEQYPADSPQNMSILAEKYGFDFPYCYDESQEVARAYGAVCTPDLFLFDADHTLYYHGQFDASRPGQGNATGADLIQAVTGLLAHQPAPLNTRPGVGCSIKWKI